jgi:hypothetical protein
LDGVLLIELARRSAKPKTIFEGRCRHVVTPKQQSACPCLLPLSHLTRARCVRCKSSPRKRLPLSHLTGARACVRCRSSPRKASRVASSKSGLFIASGAGEITASAAPRGSSCYGLEGPLGLPLGLLLRRQASAHARAGGVVLGLAYRRPGSDLPAFHPRPPAR